MKVTTIIFAFLLISINGYCDTLDYWHVYINDSIVSKFNSFSKDLSINLKRSELNSSDTITVRYGTDHPCIDCYYGLTVQSEIMQRTPAVETKKHFGKLSIPIKDLLEIEKTYHISRFPFNYYERTDKKIDKMGRLLFILTIT